MKILTSSDDNFLYNRLLMLCQQVKLVQGGTSLASTLRRHSKIKTYMIQKQVDMLDSIESRFFTDDGLNKDEIENYHLQK